MKSKSRSMFKIILKYYLLLTSSMTALFLIFQKIHWTDIPVFIVTVTVCLIIAFLVVLLINFVIVKLFRFK